MQIADRIDRLGTETAFEVLGRIATFPPERRANIISFAIGEPDFDTPEHIKRAGVESIQNNRTHYTPSAGIMPLREAIATWASETKDMTIKPEHVTVLPSAKFIIFLAIASCTNPGDEVIYPNPGYPIYESQIKTFGCKPVPALIKEEDEFNYNTDYLRGLITGKTRMIIINTPQNPTGSVLSDQNIEAIAEMALENNLWVLSDEIYSNIIFDNRRFRSIAALPGMQERTIILDGYSKYFAMTGWRLGYSITNPNLADIFSRWATNTISCTATFVQDAGLAGMTEPKDASNTMVREFQARRDLIHQGLNDIEGFSAVKPRGAFYIFANVTGACQKFGFKNSTQLQDYILDKCDVAVLSRNYFGSKPPEEEQYYIRFSYCISREQISAGLKRIKDAIENP
ncbi:MAG: pyridoxal phosphate-dependent aminotransferase [Candidatus Hodarchaeota archaeon]